MPFYMANFHSVVEVARVAVHELCSARSTAAELLPNLFVGQAAKPKQPSELRAAVGAASPVGMIFPTFHSRRSKVKFELYWNPDHNGHFRPYLPEGGWELR